MGRNERLAFNCAEAAEALHISRPTLYALLRTPGFPAFRVGNRWIISRDGLIEWIKQQTSMEENDNV